MISVSDEQNQTMLLTDREKFIDFATDRIFEESAANVGRLPKDIVREMTANGLTRAEKWGLSSAKTRLAFISIMWEIGPNFDQQPGIARALGSNPSNPDAAFDKMLDIVSEDEWREAAESHDSRYWYPELLETEEV